MGGKRTHQCILRPTALPRGLYIALTVIIRAQRRAGIYDLDRHGFIAVLVEDFVAVAAGSGTGGTLVGGAVGLLE